MDYSEVPELQAEGFMDFYCHESSALFITLGSPYWFNDKYGFNSQGVLEIAGWQDQMITTFRITPWTPEEAQEYLSPESPQKVWEYFTSETLPEAD